MYILTDKLRVAYHDYLDTLREDYIRGIIDEDTYRAHATPEGYDNWLTQVSE